MSKTTKIYRVRRKRDGKYLSGEDGFYETGTAFSRASNAKGNLTRYFQWGLRPWRGDFQESDRNRESYELVEFEVVETEVEGGVMPC